MKKSTKYKRENSNKDIKILETIFSNFRIETSGSVIKNSNEISIEIVRSMFNNCSSYNHGGAIFSSAGILFSISSSCFKGCFTNTSFGSAIYTSMTRQNFTECSFYSCGIPKASDLTEFYGSSSGISICNYTHSTVMYSIASFVGSAEAPISKFVHIAFGRSIKGVVLHANRCNNAIFENVDVVNNTDMNELWGLIHFDGTSAILNNVNIIKNVGYTFRSHVTSRSVKAKNCYYDGPDSSFDFIIDQDKQIIENHFATAACLLTEKTVKGINILQYILIDGYATF